MRNGLPVFVRGVNPDKIHVFKSAKKPFMITLREELMNDLNEQSDISDISTTILANNFEKVIKKTGGDKMTKEMPILLKFGDDVRPDVMVLQLFKIMENSLRDNNIILEPTHYAAFAFD